MDLIFVCLHESRHGGRKHRRNVDLGEKTDESPPHLPYLERLSSKDEPRRAVADVLNKWEREGNCIAKSELSRIVKEFRKFKLYHLALEGLIKVTGDILPILVCLEHYVSMCLLAKRCILDILMSLSKRVIEIRGEDIRSSDKLRRYVMNLKRDIVEEINIQQSLQEIQGIISSGKYMDSLDLTWWIYNDFDTSNWKRVFLVPIIKSLTKPTQYRWTEIVESKAGMGFAALPMVYAGAILADACLKGGLTGVPDVVDCSLMHSAMFALPIVASRGKSGVLDVYRPGSLRITLALQLPLVFIYKKAAATALLNVAVFWHIKGGIKEIMADYVHHEITRTAIMISLILFLLIAIKDSLLSLVF